ncbi:MAG: glycosyltransferase [Myxococcales bacterium]|nr:glycosyltransferase [Myxococcales bacterium]
MGTVLLISPYFPPMGVSGAKRALHLVRNLPAEGWRAIVLAAQPVNERPDPSQLADVPPEAVVDYGFNGRVRPLLRAWSERRKGSKPKEKAPAKPARPRPDWWPQDASFLTPFDRYLLDVPAGLRAARRLVRAHRPDVIHVSADPWSPLIVARQVSREFKLPLVVDFRDPWSQHAGKMALRPAPSQAALRAFEARLFAGAARVVLNTEACRDAYVAAYAGRLPADRFTAIRNAFDEGLFAPGEPTPRAAFTVAYFGRFRRFVEPDALFDGFSRFVRAEGLAPGEAALQIIGGMSAEHRERAVALGLDGYLEVTPPVPFRHSLPVLQSADVLALVINPESHLQIPGKLYDYLAARRPILAVSANAEVDAILAGTRTGLAARHGDAADIAEKLRRLRADFRPPSADMVEPFSARTQAKKMAAVYQAATRR